MGVGDPLKAAGLQVESGFGAADLGLNVHHNQVSGFGLGMGFTQCVADCGAGTLTALDIISNDLLQNNTAMALDGALAAPLNLHHNRIYGPGLVGLQNRLLTSVPAMDNWWGCNDGPGMEGCTLLVGPAEVEPWLVLSVAASPPLIRPAGSAEIVIDGIADQALETLSPRGDAAEERADHVDVTAAVITRDLAMIALPVFCAAVSADREGDRWRRPA